MLPDWVSNPGPLTYESGALPIALRGPAGVIIDLVLLTCYLANVFFKPEHPQMMNHTYFKNN